MGKKYKADRVKITIDGVEIDGFAEIFICSDCKVDRYDSCSAKYIGYVECKIVSADDKFFKRLVKIAKK